MPSAARQGKVATRDGFAHRGDPSPRERHPQAVGANLSGKIGVGHAQALTFRHWAAVPAGMPYPLNHVRRSTQTWSGTELKPRKPGCFHSRTIPCGKSQRPKPSITGWDRF